MAGTLGMHFPWVRGELDRSGGLRRGLMSGAAAFFVAANELIPLAEMEPSMRDGGRIS